MSNNQKLREVLGEIILLTYKVGKSIKADVACGIIAAKAKSAFHTPLRNCDVGTVEEQAERFKKFCNDHQEPWHGCSNYCPVLMSEKCALAWAQMPYEGVTE